MVLKYARVSSYKLYISTQIPPTNCDREKWFRDMKLVPVGMKIKCVSFFSYYSAMLFSKKAFYEYG